MEVKKQVTEEKIFRVFQFEYWLRFYFIEEEGSKLTFNFEEEFVKSLQENYGELANLALKLNGQYLSPELSRQKIVEFLQETFDDPASKRDLITPILDSKSFLRKMQLFNVWVSLFEAKLEEEILPFENWVISFNKWLESEQGQKVLYSLKLNKLKKPSSKEVN